MRFPLTILLAALWTSTAVAQPLAFLADSPLEPASTGGLQVVERALVKLSTHRRLLVVGAHPDDEDTTLLAFVGTGLGGEAAYLSLSRGEGGQNLIGTELGTGLGLIRTGELVAARRIEGTDQFFTRAYDFGYTRSLTEIFDSLAPCRPPRGCRACGAPLQTAGRRRRLSRQWPSRARPAPSFRSDCGGSLRSRRRARSVP